MEDPTDMNSSETISDKENIYESERARWKETYLKCSQMLQSLDDLSLLQVEVHSSIARVLDQRQKYASIYYKRNKELRDKKRRGLAKIYKSQNRFTSKEKDIYLEGGLSSDYLVMDLLNDHIEFYDKLYKAFQNMLYSVKNRIELERYISPM